MSEKNKKNKRNRIVIQNIKNKNAISIYGDIGYSNNTDAELEQCLNNINENEPLTVYINSYGGEVSNGIAMYNQLKKFKDLTVVVQGVCMSIATVIAMASKKIVMNKGSMFMIHKPLCFSYGNAEDFQKTIEMLDKVEESIIDIYLEHSDMTKEEIADLMSKEKFLDRYEAMEIFKNIVIEDEEETEDEEDTEDVDDFTNKKQNEITNKTVIDDEKKMIEKLSLELDFI